MHIARVLVIGSIMRTWETYCNWGQKGDSSVEYILCLYLWFVRKSQKLLLFANLRGTPRGGVAQT